MPDFWDSYVEASGGANAWIRKEEKERLIAERAPLPVTNVTFQSGDKYGARYVLNLELPTGENGENERRLIGFAVDSGVTTRDALLEQLYNYFTEKGEDSDPVTLMMEKAGNAVLLKKYEPLRDDPDVPF